MLSFLRHSDSIFKSAAGLNWGTGELVFLNDLFPKDWQSFFTGRNFEYLKAPCDAVKVSLFANNLNFDLVYLPQFNSDRYITGRYLSYWNDSAAKLVGRNQIVSPVSRNKLYKEDELALRVYWNRNNLEYALYSYRGFWKSPSGKTADGNPYFPTLNTIGASVRGKLGNGIGNVEIASYDSLDDRDDVNPDIPGSGMRYLVGYVQEAGKDSTVSIQYYVEQKLEYNNYCKNLVSGRRHDEFRQLITGQLVKLLMNQNLEVTLAGYFCFSDSDAYLRPGINYKYTDAISFEAGANIFLGSSSDTFFAQYTSNSNIYAAVRYCF
jgi:hypothetical protein